VQRDQCRGEILNIDLAITQSAQILNKFLDRLQVSSNLSMYPGNWDCFLGLGEGLFLVNAADEVEQEDRKEGKAAKKATAEGGFEQTGAKEDAESED